MALANRSPIAFETIGWRCRRRTGFALGRRPSRPGWVRLGPHVTFVAQALRSLFLQRALQNGRYALLGA
jgi:hypothetical protein